MPTHEETARFWADWQRLSPDERRRFRDAVQKFSQDLQRSPRGPFRPSLRVKPMQGAGGIFEMTWEIADGRATFQYGEERVPGEPHIVWRRVGGHEVIRQP